MKHILDLKSEMKLLSGRLSYPLESGNEWKPNFNLLCATSNDIINLEEVLTNDDVFTIWLVNKNFNSKN